MAYTSARCGLLHVRQTPVRAVHMYLPPHLLRQPGMSDEPAGTTVGDGAGSPENGARRYLAELRNSKGLNPALRDRER